MNDIDTRPLHIERCVRNALENWNNNNYYSRQKKRLRYLRELGIPCETPQQLAEWIGNFRKSKVRIWAFPRQDFPLWLETCADTQMDWHEYKLHFNGIIAEYERQGLLVETVKIPVQKMLDELKRQGLPNTPTNRAAIAAEY